MNLRRLKPEIWVLVVLVVGAAGFFVWDRYFTYDPAEVYANAKKQYVEAMTTDTYGGKTPQGTLDLFVAALKKEDIELASKYFLLDDDSSSSDYLTWNKYKLELQKAQNERRITNIINILSRVVPDSENIFGESDYKFSVYNSGGKLEAYINMELNKYSGVWKIESI